jgi:prepilin-type N-terminal cleavage/methylation domain-containing protein
MKTEQANMRFTSPGRMPHACTRRGILPARRGFTLVELLVVITIIGILASLITVAASNALWNANQTRIKVELDNLDLAMKSLKAETGSYPPCNLTFEPSATVPTAANFNLPLKQYIATRFPRYKQTSPDGTYTKLKNDLESAGINTAPGAANVDPARALVFWLSPFSADVTRPFLIETFTDTNGNGIWDQGETYTDDPNGTNGVYDGASQTKAAFEFDRTRLVQRGTNTKYRVYTPPKGKDAPYVYFDSASYGTLNQTSHFRDSVGGVVQPYILDVNNNRTIDTGTPTTPGDTFANPDSCQIISAGQDGQFGSSSLTGAGPFVSRLYPGGLNYDTGGADNDNVANFSDKNNLDAAKP